MTDGIIGNTLLIKRLASELPDWYPGAEETDIRRCYKTNGWKSSLMIVNTIGFLSEASWHHPELVVSYSAVVIHLTTHSEGGVTEKDFALAKKIDQLVQWSPVDSVLDCPPDKYAMLKPD